ncbi:Fatty acid desaturase 4, chloroplastic [Asimina triloba]
MSALGQQWHWHLSGRPCHKHTCRHPRPSFTRATLTTTTAPTLNQPNVPKSRNSVSISTTDPSRKSTSSHRAWVACGGTSVLVSLAKSIASAADSGEWLEPLIMGVLGYLLADLGTGVYHWGIDNYGDASTPIFGSQIEAFQGHHKWPWTITRRQFANNLHALARAVFFVVAPLDLVPSHAAAHMFVAVCSGCIMFSQQFHAWAHGTKSRLPALVVALQDAGVLISRAKHAAHHRPPYDNNYCIVSGVWNEVLDGVKLFEAMEMVVFFKFGVRPRSWTEPNEEWMEDTEAPDASSSIAMLKI